MKHPFTDEELITILEAARQGLADADNFDALADAMDISDDEMKRIQEKLESYLQNEGG